VIQIVRTNARPSTRIGPEQHSA